MDNVVDTVADGIQSFKDAVIALWDDAVTDFENYTGLTEFEEIGDTYIKSQGFSKEQGNAFLHAYVSAELAVKWGDGIANTLGWGREFGSLITRDLRNLVEDRDISEFVNSQLDSHGDIYNNQIGLQIGFYVNAGVISRDQIPEIVHKAMETGQLVVDKNNDPRVNGWGYKTPEFNLGKALNGDDNPQCFPADTKILLADGTEKPISDITTADKVAAFHPSNFAGRGGLEGKQVVRLFDNITDVWVQLSNGASNDNHVIYLEVA